MLVPFLLWVLILLIVSLRLPQLLLLLLFLLLLLLPLLLEQVLPQHVGTLPGVVVGVQERDVERRVRCLLGSSVEEGWRGGGGARGEAAYELLTCVRLSGVPGSGHVHGNGDLQGARSMHAGAA